MEMDVIYFKVISQQLSRRSTENHRNLSHESHPLIHDSKQQPPEYKANPSTTKWSNSRVHCLRCGYLKNIFRGL